MSPRLFLMTFVLLAGCQQEQSTQPETSMNAEPEEALQYPITDKVAQTDNYHGVDVADPFRWLEDDVRESTDVNEWVAAQNRLTFSYLEKIPERDLIEKRLTKLWDFEKFGVPFKEGGQYFYFANDGLQNQNVLFRQTSLDSEPVLVVDPNTWSDDGTVAMAGIEISPDGKLAAMAVQDGGSDWRTIRFLEVETGKQLDDTVEWMKFSGMSWAKDSSGIFYSRYPEPEEGEEFQSLNKNQSVYFHKIGTSQFDDRLVHARADNPDWGFAANVTEDGNYLVITVWKGTDDRYQIVYYDLKNAADKAVTLIEGFDYDYSFVGNTGPVFFFRTNNSAPKGRVIAIDTRQPDSDAWQELVPEAESVLDGVAFLGGRFIAHYLKDARSEALIYTQEGKLESEVALPGIGAAYGFNGKPNSTEMFYAYSSYNAPTTIYRYDLDSKESDTFKAAKVDFDPEDYVVKQVFFESKDGTRVPMFITHKKDLELDGNRPTLLYGYGGFNISLTPDFSISRLAWVEMGGVYAVANLRGGGEYGQAWHKAGTKLQKQNVFDDFIAAGEYLVDTNYTNPKKLAVFGGSNGGLLVGAVVNQRPDLFGAAIPAVGVMDMLRFHKFTAGRFWVDDYGSADNPDEFKALYAYSPYHNIKDGESYPAVMVTTADTDDRVVPGHSFKYAARLQEAQGGSAPVLIRIETRAGHGAGKPTKMVIEEYADRWAFLAKNLGLDLPEGYGQAADL